MVEHSVWDREVAGSNPVFPTISLLKPDFSGFFICRKNMRRFSFNVMLLKSIPNNKRVKLLDDNEKCFGVLANMNFLLVCEYGEDGKNSEVIIYKRR